MGGWRRPLWGLPRLEMDHVATLRLNPEQLGCEAWPNVFDVSERASQGHAARTPRQEWFMQRLVSSTVVHIEVDTE